MPKILDGIRILDLTHYWFGPFCTMLLGDMGAEVIKIEPPWGEMNRFFPPLVNGASPYFLYLNRSKKGMTLNLKHQSGVKVFKDLVRISDVLVQSYSPGAMDRLGLGYEELRKINPKLIYASLSGFGQTGPYASRLSFDIVAQAMCGIMSLTGERYDPKGPPIHTEEAIGDLIPALFADIGILAALYARKTTGTGQMIDVAQVDTMIAMIPSTVLHSLTGEKPVDTYRKYFTGIYGMFESADGYVVIGAPMGEILERLARVLAVEKIDNRDMVRDWLKARPTKEIVERLVEARVPVAPVLGVDQVFEDPHIIARGMVALLEHPQSGKTKMPNFPIKFSETTVSPNIPAPMLGQHTEEILTRLLGYSKEDVERLRHEGAL
jgi:CoA:oxalate CoA-transferase